MGAWGLGFGKKCVGLSDMQATSTTEPRSDACMNGQSHTNIKDGWGDAHPLCLDHLLILACQQTHFLIVLGRQQRRCLGGREQHRHERAVDGLVGAGAQDAAGQLRDGRSVQEGAAAVVDRSHSR